MAKNGQTGNNEDLEEQKPKSPYHDDIVRITAGAKEAAKALEVLMSKASKLQSLADQGEGAQKGTLSPAQIKMYREILNEIKKIKETYINIAKDGRTKVEGERGDLQDKIEYQQKLILRAKGGDPFANDPKYQGMENTYGDVASDTIISAMEKRLEELIQQDTKGVDQLEKALNALEAAIKDLEVPSRIADNQSDRIGELRQTTPELDRAIEQLGNTIAGSIGFMGMGQYAGYIGSGIDELRRQEATSYDITQSVSGGKVKDDDYRDLAQEAGLKNDFTARETLQLQNQLREGGATVKELQGTAEVSQQFSREYAIDPSMFANLTVTLDKAVEIDKGSTKDIANLLGGAIEKGNMRGREAEMLRASNALISQNTAGRVGVLPQDAQNIIAMQTMLAKYDKSLSGDAGAGMLQNIDSSIQNGGQNIDLLLGKGTKFKGPEGLWDLELQKEKGIADPENLKTIFENVDKGIGNQASAKRLLKDELHIKPSQVEALWGLKDQITSGEDMSGEINSIMQEGKKSSKVRQDNYNQMQSQQRFDVEAQNEDRKMTHVKPFEEIATTGNQMFNAIPEPLQHIALTGMGVGGALLAKAGIQGGLGLASKVLPKIKDMGSGGVGGALKGAGAGIMSFGKSAWEKASGLFKRGGGGGGTPPVPPVGGAPLPPAGGGSLWSRGIGAVGKKLPVIGAGITAGMALSEGDSWGKSLFRGAGGLVGGILGAGAVGTATGGLGIAAGAVGGGIAGEYAAGKVWDGVSSFFGGEKVGAEGKEAPTKVKADTEAKATEIDPKAVDADRSSLRVDNLYVKDKSLADLLGGKDSSNTSRISRDEKVAKANAKDVNVNLNIGGKVEGMSKENEKEVAKASIDWMNRSSSNLGMDILNLGTDTTRY